VIQFRPDRSQDFYAPGRDILGFFRPLYLETLEIMHERHKDKTEEVQKLEMLMNGMINEATAGVHKLEMPAIISAWQESLKEVDDEIADEFCRIFTSAMVFRYVLGKREVPEDQVKQEELGNAFSGLYMLSVLPEKLYWIIPFREKVRQHMRTYNHIPKIAVTNTPPCTVVEATDTDE
jgi:hypothetical protein